MMKTLLALFAVVILAVPTCSVQAQPCGDADDNGMITINDMVYMMQYLFAGGPPPNDFDYADFDFHQEWTVNDASWLFNCIFTDCGPGFVNCPPTSGPYAPVETPGSRIRHTAAFPGHKTSSIVDLALDAPSKEGIQLPLRILVDSLPAHIDSVQFPLPDSDFRSGINKVVILDSSGIVVFGSTLIFWHSPATKLARVFISAPMDTASRLINLEFADYVPALAPPGHDGPITPMIVTWNVPVKPSFLGTCCLVPGDADGNGLQSISDAVYLINYYFAGGPSPHSCLALGDADGNGILTISDAVYLINYIFSGGPAPMCT